MKNVFFLLFTAGCLLVSAERVAAQDNKVINDKNAQKREVRNFHGIEISGGIDLYLNQGGEEAVAVSAAEPEWRDRIRTEVLDGVLHIYMDSKGFNW